MARIKREDIVNELAPLNWELVSKEYTNLESELIFKCPEGHEVYSSWKKMRNKPNCPVCLNNQYKTNKSEVIPKQKKVKRILALDQATHISGWCIYDGEQLIKYGIFKAPDTSDEIKRDNAIKIWLMSMINNWQPDFVAIEGIQLQDESSGNKMGVTVFETLARLQGILMETCYELKIPYEICPTNTWRKFCGVRGRSRADKKRSMQVLAKQWYDITVTDDEADVIGIGRYMANIIKGKFTVSSWE